MAGNKKTSLAPIQKVLIFIGKPFYYLFAFLTFLVIFLINSANFTRKILVHTPKKLFIIIFLLVIVTGLYIKLTILKDLPSPMDLTNRNLDVSTKIFDRNGVLLYQIYKDKNRTIVPLNNIPLNVRLATLAAEDAEFYNHPGFSIRGIIRAIRTNARTGQITGGSTITQQLVKNALLTPEKTLTRKLKEFVLSLETEATYSKDRILEMYLNEVSYGGPAYGIEEASRLYFDKDVKDLSLSEAALLAGLPKSPTRFSPYGADPKLALERQKEVLKLMAINKFITYEDVQEAESKPLIFASNNVSIKAPHFVMYVKENLVNKYSEEDIEKGGLSVYTTLDYSIQKMAEGVVASEIDKLKKLNVKNAAVLILNPKTGEILTMVGSRDYFDNNNDGNVNVTTSLRQPGSSIKIINYAYALSHGYSLSSVLIDSPVTYSIPGSPAYTPKNYDGKFVGKITLRNALAQSRNIPAVKVLASIGVDKMLEMGKEMGITTWSDPSIYGLSLTLGGGEVKLTDLATAYATVANMGERPTLRSILSIKNYTGKLINEDKCISSGNSKIFEFDTYKALGLNKDCQNEKVLDPRVAFLLIDILRDNIARSAEFGLNSALVINNHPEVAVKTGTSNDLRDNLTVGFNQKYLVAVWVGNNDGSPMSRIASGITGAAPIFNKIMSNLLAKEGSNDWIVPKGLEKISICSTKPEWLFSENKPIEKCGGKILEPAVSISK